MGKRRGCRFKRKSKERWIEPFRKQYIIREVKEGEERKNRKTSRSGRG